MMNKHKPIRIGYIGFCLNGGSRYNSMVAKASMTSAWGQSFLVAG